MQLQAENISRRYMRQSGASNFFLAVRDTSLELADGELIAVTGRSGSGKSTLLNLLAGLLEPTEGRVLWDGADIYQLTDAERSRLRNQRVGVIPQGHTGLHSLNVLENVMLPGLMYAGQADEARARELLAWVGIGHLAAAYPRELSGGELRRLAIARALLNQPGLLLADEPTGDLDDENTRLVLELLRRTADQGTAVFLVTHENEAAAYADRVYRMNEGLLTPLAAPEA